MNAWDLLREPYLRWVTANSLPDESAEELLYRDTLTYEQRNWLTAFVALWEATNDIVRECGTCGKPAGDDWITANDEYQEIVCAECQRKSGISKLEADRNIGETDVKEEV